MAGNQNHGDDASSRKRFKTCDNGGVAPWLELNRDVHLVVMMKLGVIDFISFSGVCKSWRSLAVSNKNKFMASKPPMKMQISYYNYNKEFYCYLEDFEGRKFKTLLPHSSGRIYLGLTCGYLILFEEEKKDFWLVNPITRHELHFPPFRYSKYVYPTKAILVFSPSTRGWVFVILSKCQCEIWFCIAGTGAWNYVSSTCPIIDLHAFKGRIYTLHSGWHLSEMRLNPKPTLILLQNTFICKPHDLSPDFVNSGDNLFVSNNIFRDPYVYELDFSKMKWVPVGEKAIRKYAFFFSVKRLGAAIKPKSWATDFRSQYKRYGFFPNDKARKGRFFKAHMWYFPHECMSFDLIDE